MGRIDIVKNDMDRLSKMLTGISDAGAAVEGGGGEG